MSEGPPKRKLGSVVSRFPHFVSGGWEQHMADGGFLIRFDGGRNKERKER